MGSGEHTYAALEAQFLDTPRLHCVLGARATDGRSNLGRAESVKNCKETFRKRHLRTTPGPQIEERFQGFSYEWRAIFGRKQTPLSFSFYRVHSP